MVIVSVTGGVEVGTEKVWRGFAFQFTKAGSLAVFEEAKAS